MDTTQKAKTISNFATKDDPRWMRVLARDKSADGEFWYSVATTGVYCRPSCPSRTANPNYDAGFNSSGRFYEQSTNLLGMTPMRYKAGGAQEELWFAIGASSLGAILVASSERGVASILIGEDPNALAENLQDRFPRARLIGGDRAYEKLVAQVIGFVEEPRLGLNLPLDVRGTAFQQRVWQALREIPAGGTASYAEIAARIGSPKSVRAVAGACAANNLAVAIPCHRVVRNDGALSGYAWGVDRKRTLIARESAGA